jgi:hypothetical protein
VGLEKVGKESYGQNSLRGDWVCFLPMEKKFVPNFFKRQLAEHIMLFHVPGFLSKLQKESTAMSPCSLESSHPVFQHLL